LLTIDRANTSADVPIVPDHAMTGHDHGERSGKDIVGFRRNGLSEQRFAGIATGSGKVTPINPSPGATRVTAPSDVSTNAYRTLLILTGNENARRVQFVDGGAHRNVRFGNAYCSDVSNGSP
jgi:hypothetical protein